MQIVLYVGVKMNIVTNNKRIKIYDELLTIINKYSHQSQNYLEAGGVLIGRENLNDSNLIIDHLTEPLKKDKRKRFAFDRKDSGHIETFTNLYNVSNGCYAYIGEWHTHPEAIPNYSRKDLFNWQKINKKAPRGTVNYHIIAGYDVLRLWQCKDGGKTIILISSIHWEEL